MLDRSYTADVKARTLSDKDYQLNGVDFSGHQSL